MLRDLWKEGRRPGERGRDTHATTVWTPVHICRNHLWQKPGHGTQGLRNWPECPGGREPLSLPSPPLCSSQLARGSRWQSRHQAQAEKRPLPPSSLSASLAWPDRGALASPNLHCLQKDRVMGSQRGMEMRMNTLVHSLPQIIQA